MANTENDMDINEEIGMAVQRAAKELPEGYTVMIELERDAGSVTLLIPPVSDDEPGRAVDDFRGDCFADFLNNAIGMAIEHAEEVGADGTAKYGEKEPLHGKDAYQLSDA